jgi:hypothetical protein
VDGSIADVVAVGIYSGPGSSKVQPPSQKNQTLFYVDHSTGLVVRVQQLNYSENVQNSTQTLETRYSDYRKIDGFMVPFHQQTYADGKLLFDLLLNSASFGVAVTESDFGFGL